MPSRYVSSKAASSIDTGQACKALVAERYDRTGIRSIGMVSSIGMDRYAGKVMAPNTSQKPVGPQPTLRLGKS
jgi:hypothetical protein